MLKHLVHLTFYVCYVYIKTKGKGVLTSICASVSVSLSASRFERATAHCMLSTIACSHSKISIQNAPFSV